MKPARLSSQTAGLTLIELVVAMGVFALIATMGLQSMTGTLRVRDRMTERADNNDQLILATALLRNDLAAVVPLAFYPPGGALLRAAVALDGQRLSLSVAGQPGLPPWPATGGLHRVIWELDPRTQTLTRRVWPVLSPASDSQISPVMPVLTGVTGWQLRSYWPETGWTDGLHNPGLIIAPQANIDGDVTIAPEVYSSTLPLGVELTLDSTNWGTLVLIEALE